MEWPRKVSIIIIFFIVKEEERTSRIFFFKIIIINSLFVFIYIRIYKMREESEFDQLEQPLSSILKRG